MCNFMLDVQLKKFEIIQKSINGNESKNALYIRILRFITMLLLKNKNFKSKKT